MIENGWCEYKFHFRILPEIVIQSENVYISIICIMYETKRFNDLLILRVLRSTHREWTAYKSTNNNDINEKTTRKNFIRNTKDMNQRNADAKRV